MTRDTAPDTERLLTPDDPPPFRMLAARGSVPLLLVCDHAASTVPRRLGSLGLPEAELGRHIGWDLGAEAVARRLADRLGAGAVLCSFSRLVVDCNRRLDDPSAFAVESDGTVVPGNAAPAAKARRARAEEIYWPYHGAIAAALDDLQGRTAMPSLVSVHSFTPRLRLGQDRPWHMGVLWNQDPRLAHPLLAALRRTELTVGDNEPYSGRGPGGFTMAHHADTRGLPSVELEIRQDQIDSEEGVRRYAGLLAEALGPILSAFASEAGSRRPGGAGPERA